VHGGVYSESFMVYLTPSETIFAIFTTYYNARQNDLYFWLPQSVFRYRFWSVISSLITSSFFDVKPAANALVFFHGIVMTLWVIYFSVQIAPVRSKNIKLHMTMGLAEIVLAAIVALVGLATANEAQIVRQSAPPGANPHSFFFPCVRYGFVRDIVRGGNLLRKASRGIQKPNAADGNQFSARPLFFRIPVVPEEYVVLWSFGVPNLIALGCFAWYTAKQGKFNKVFAAGISLLFVAFPSRIIVSESKIWLQFVGWLAS
jgi:hypothetical protein